MDAENTFQVFDWLWTSGQLTEKDINSLSNYGIRTVINLAPPNSSNALRGEAELVTGLGMNYIQIPVKWEQPTIEQLEQFCIALRTHEGRPCWVHCAKNMRVSAFLYIYRSIFLNEPEEVASYPMTEIWEPNPIWKAFIDDAMTQFAKRRRPIQQSTNSNNA